MLWLEREPDRDAFELWLVSAPPVQPEIDPDQAELLEVYGLRRPGG